MDLRPHPQDPLRPPPQNSLCTVFCWENQDLHKEFGRLSPLLDPPARVPPKFFMQIFFGCSPAKRGRWGRGSVKIEPGFSRFFKNPEKTRLKPGKNPVKPGKTVGKCGEYAESWGSGDVVTDGDVPLTYLPGEKPGKKPGSIFHRPPPHRPLLAGADYFWAVGFVRGFKRRTLTHFCGQGARQHPPEIPWQNPPEFATQTSPTHFCRWTGQKFLNASYVSQSPDLPLPHGLAPSETMVSDHGLGPPLSTENPRNKGCSGLGAPHFWIWSRRPRDQGVGVDPCLLNVRRGKTWAIAFRRFFV